MRIKQADDLLRQLGKPSEDSRLSLPYHAADTIRHGLQLLAQSTHLVPATTRQTIDFSQHSSRVAENLSGHVKKFPVLSFALLFSLRPLVTQCVRDHNHPLRYTTLPVADLPFQAADRCPASTILSGNSNCRRLSAQTSSSSWSIREHHRPTSRCRSDSEYWIQPPSYPPPEPRLRQGALPRPSLISRNSLTRDNS